MPRISLDTDQDHLVTPKHSDARGPVVRGKSIEIMQMNWRAGDTGLSTARSAPKCSAPSRS